ncbi:MAG: hypothetical protein Q7R95_10710 [bacterium]|nr:hypothetical protein [bacterium]
MTLLKPQEIRHLLDILIFEDLGKYDIITGKWTYPKDIRKKLVKILNQNKSKKYKCVK